MMYEMRQSKVQSSVQRRGCYYLNLEDIATETVTTNHGGFCFSIVWCFQAVFFLDGDRILVFVETKRSADFLASFLSQRNFPTTSISR